MENSIMHCNWLLTPIAIGVQETPARLLRELTAKDKALAALAAKDAEVAALAAEVRGPQQPLALQLDCNA